MKNIYEFAILLVVAILKNAAGHVNPRSHYSRPGDLAVQNELSFEGPHGEIVIEGEASLMIGGRGLAEISCTKAATLNCKKTPKCRRIKKKVPKAKCIQKCHEGQVSRLRQCLTEKNNALQGAETTAKALEGGLDQCSLDLQVTKERLNKASCKWKFSVLVGIENTTMEHYGGYDATVELLLHAMEIVNSKFTSATFGKDVVFEVDEESIFVIDGPTQPHISDPHPSHDYFLIVDGGPEGSGGGWYGHLKTIRHAWQFDYFGGTFDSSAVDGLAHEFGHARGCIDIYATETEDAENIGTGKTYEGPTSIMNYPYGESRWDEHCIAVVNYGGADVVKSEMPGGEIFIQNYWPPKIVFDTGAGAPGAKLYLHKIEWFSYSIESDPDQVLIADNSGKAILDMKSNNPYGPEAGNSRPAWGITVPNYLVVVKVNGVVVDDFFMPFTDVNLFAFKNPGEPYIAYQQ